MPWLHVHRREKKGEEGSIAHELEKTHCDSGVRVFGAADCLRNSRATRSRQSSGCGDLQSHGDDRPGHGSACHDADPADECRGRQDFCDTSAIARLPASGTKRGEACRRDFGAARQFGIHARVHDGETRIRTLEQRRAAAPGDARSGCGRCGNNGDDCTDAAPRIEIRAMRKTYTSAISSITILLSLAHATLAQHVITTVAGGVPNNVPALQVGVGLPGGLFRDSSGNLYIAAILNNAVFKVNSSGQLTTVAGNEAYGYSGDGGPATSAELAGPSAVFVDGSGNIFIADRDNNRIREVVAATGNIQTVAGNGTVGFSGDGGPATSAALRDPFAVFVDGSGDIFIADTGNYRIREVIAATGNIQTVAGNGGYGFSGDGGSANRAELLPTCIFLDGSGNLFICDDGGNQRVREVIAATGNIQTVVGNGTYGFSGDGGPATSAALSNPSSVFVDGSRNIFIADRDNNRIREVVAATGDIQTVAGNGNARFTFSGDGGPAISGALYRPEVVYVDSSGNIFIADTGNNRVREVVAATGNIETVAGNGSYGSSSGDGGLATSAQLNDPWSVFVDGSGNIFIADRDNNRIREVVAATGNIQTVAGNGTDGFTCGGGGVATIAHAYYLPEDVYGDGYGNIVNADTGNNREVEVAAGKG